MVNNLKCVFIDWNKTLSYNLFWEHLSDPIHANHGLLAPIEKWLFQDHSDVIQPWMLGELSTEAIISKLSSDLPIDPTIVLHDLQISCEQMVFCSENIPNLIRTIRKQNILVVIATDNMDTFRRFTVPSLKLDSLCDDLLISSELHALKDVPGPANSLPFFDSYLQAHKLGYDDVLLLDDSPDKTGVYAKLGFKRITITSPDHLIQELEAIAKS